MDASQGPCGGEKMALSGARVDPAWNARIMTAEIVATQVPEGLHPDRPCAARRVPGSRGCENRSEESPSGAASRRAVLVAALPRGKAPGAGDAPGHARTGA